MTEGFRVNLIIPRVPPLQSGLSVLYDGIVKRAPQTGETRHMLDDDLERIHPHWFSTLTILRKMGCVEWRMSSEVKDLPREKRR